LKHRCFLDQLPANLHDQIKEGEKTDYFKDWSVL
jgi:hypothetical protein